MLQRRWPRRRLLTDVRVNPCSQVNITEDSTEGAVLECCKNGRCITETESIRQICQVVVE
jgi:hypothetical protein